MSKTNFPELPPVPEKQPNYDGGDDYWTEAAFERYATAYAEEAVRQALAAFLSRASNRAIAGALLVDDLRHIALAIIPENDHGEST